MNAIEPTVITLDRERHLKCNLATLKQINAITGKNLLAGESPLEGLTPDKVAEVLVAMLKHEDPLISVDAVMQAVDARQLRYIIERMAVAMLGEDALVDQKSGASPLPATVQ